MSTFTRLLLGTLAVAATALTLAQGVPSAPHLSVIQKSTFLLMNPQIRSEVRLSVAQQGAVTKAISEYATSQQKLMASKNPLDSEIRALDTGYSKKALAAIDAAQEKKLLVLTIRQIGVQALADKEIATRVGLTKGQTNKVSVLLKKISARKLAFDEMLAKGLAHMEPGDQAAMTKQRAEIVKSYDSERVKLQSDLKVLQASVVGTLGAAQKAKWIALQS